MTPPRIRYIVTVPTHSPQVMNHIPAGHQHHAFVTQRRQLTTHLKMPCRRFGTINTKLHHRDIRIRVHLDQYAPGAVIKSPRFFIERDGNGSQQFNQTLRQRRRSRAG